MPKHNYGIPLSRNFELRGSDSLLNRDQPIVAAEEDLASRDGGRGEKTGLHRIPGENLELALRGEDDRSRSRSEVDLPSPPPVPPKDTAGPALKEPARRRIDRLTTPASLAMYRPW
jgi:hypothetical protein